MCQPTRDTLGTEGAGVWNHVVYTADYTTFEVRLYVNGDPSPVCKGSAPPSYAADKIILGRSGDNGRAYKGYIRQFYLYERVLNANEVTQLFEFDA